MLYYPGRARVVDSNGDPVSNAKLYFYLTGTSDPTPVYSDSLLTVEHTQPVRSNSAGFFPPVYLDPAVTHKSITTTADDVSLPDGTVDPVIQSAFTAEAIGEALYPRTAAEIAAGVTPTNYAYEPNNAQRFGAPVTGLTSANAGIANADLAAVAGASLVTFSPGTYLIDDDITVTSGLNIQPGAVLSIAIGKTLTLPNHAKFIAGESMRCITGSGSIKFGYDVVANVYAAWFGFGHAFTAAQNKAALMAAMNSLSVSGQARGGTVVLPNTACSIVGDIVPPANGIRLLGQGWAAGYNDSTQLGTLLSFTSGTSGIDATADYSAPAPNEYLLIEGIRIDGGGVLTYGIRVKGTKFIRGCLVTGCATAGIFLEDFLNGTVVEQTTCIANGAAGTGVGLIADGANTTKYTIKDCTFRLNFRGMELRSGNGHSIEDCVFEANVERGLLERNSDGRNLTNGYHKQLWFEANNSLAATRSQFSMATTATDPVYYPVGNLWVGGNVNGGAVAGQRAMDIAANCLGTKFIGTRFAGIAADTSSILVAAGTRTIFEDCYDVETYGSASAANFLLLNSGRTPQTLTGAGAVSLFTRVTLLITTGANALTLADGAEGQEKKIVMKTDGGVGTLTPTNLYNGSTLTFDDVGDSADLLFTDGQWVFIGGTATLA